jgi:hypothetical protein
MNRFEQLPVGASPPSFVTVNRGFKPKLPLGKNYAAGLIG